MQIASTSIEVCSIQLMRNILLSFTSFIQAPFFWVESGAVDPGIKSQGWELCFESLDGALLGAFCVGALRARRESIISPSFPIDPRPVPAYNANGL